MTPAQILFPTCGLAALTFIVLLLIPLARFRADFRYGESANVPGEVSLPYVALRAVHSAIHLTYNNVFHRLGAYAASNVVLIALWIRWALAIGAGT